MAINYDFLNNNVDAAHQVSFPYYIDGDVKTAGRTVMFIGNSITYHEYKPEIGWTRKCGMAASDIDHDYVHLVLKHLREEEPSTAAVVFNGGQWELDYTNGSKLQTILDVVNKYKPFLIVCRIGENYNKKYLKEECIDPFPSFNALVKGCKAVTDNVIVTSLFWEFPILDAAIKKAADENDAKYIVINDLGYKDENKAIGLFGHPGVAGHPGDLGMERIAERIIKAI